jgi:hypothetical protein
MMGADYHLQRTYFTRCIFSPKILNKKNNRNFDFLGIACPLVLILVKTKLCCGVSFLKSVLARHHGSPWPKMGFRVRNE